MKPLALSRAARALAISCAALAIGLVSVSLKADDNEPDDISLLLQATVMPDYELDGLTFGNGQEFLPAFQGGDLRTAVFASYSENAGNAVHMLVDLSGRGPVQDGQPIAAEDAIIVITDFPAGTDFPNAHAFLDLDGDPMTPANPVYWYGIVKRTMTGDDYRTIQIRRPNAEPFLLSFEVFGTLR